LHSAGHTIYVDGQELPLDTTAKEMWFEHTQEYKWKACLPREAPLTGPISRILTYGSPLTIVIPASDVSYSITGCDASSEPAQYSRLANRLSFNLLTYLGLDSNIMTDTEAVRKQLENSGRGIIVLGGPGVNLYASYALQPSFPIRFSSANKKMGNFQIKHRVFDQKGTALLFMDRRHLYICAFDMDGYERAIRAFPLRTGTSNPEWLMIGSDADFLSTGGILGAGFWGRDGKYSEAMSWLC